MKTLLLTTIVLVYFASGTTVAQKSIRTNHINMIKDFSSNRTCGTMEKLQEQMQQDPTLYRRIEDTELMVQNWMAAHQNEIKNKALVTIPVVVHVLWNTLAENISDTTILQQIDILNADYRKLNTDTANIPSVWKSVASDFEIQFCLASRKPDGTETTGIERKQTAISTFVQSGDSMKYDSRGGLNAWDATKYLNLWVCNLASPLAGFAQLPSLLSTNPATDGVVILYKVFGLSGTLGAPYNLGRTSTHEIGHWLNLRHIWGDDNGACTGSDYCNDTPNAANATYGCPAFPLIDICTTTSPGIMFMDYMDYSDDACMCMFTNDQKTRAKAALSILRVGLLTSTGCQNGVGIAENNLDNIEIFPNPTNGKFNVISTNFGGEATITVINSMGEIVVKKNHKGFVNNTLQLDLSDRPSGIYYVNIENNTENISRKISLIN